MNVDDPSNESHRGHAASRLTRTIFAATLVCAPALTFAQDAGAGKTVFVQQCAACHATTDSNGIGPGLKGIDGRKVGSGANFRYSSAMKEVAYAWDAKTLDAFLAAPSKAIPGSAMPFAGLSDGKQRADVIAYMQTLK
jgi:cytochrome c